MIVHYGYSNGQGEFRITVDTEKCDGCGACVEVCPEQLFELQANDYDEMKVVVKPEMINMLGYLCPGASTCGRNQQKNCHHVCPHQALAHSW